MSTITKAELSDTLSEKTKMNKKDAKEMVELVFEEIRHALEEGTSVKISGFGNFDVRKKDQRPGRNPKTGEEIPVQARCVVTFNPGQKLRGRVEESAVLQNLIKSETEK